MRVSARADYAIRALLELAAAGTTSRCAARPSPGPRRIPAKYLENLLADLRRARLVVSQRGLSGGYRLARPAAAITLADVIRAIDGPLAGVRDAAPEDVTYPGAAASLREVWIALRASMRTVLEATTLADVAAGSSRPASAPPEGPGGLDPPLTNGAVASRRRSQLRDAEEQPA